MNGRKIVAISVFALFALVACADAPASLEAAHIEDDHNIVDMINGTNTITPARATGRGPANVPPGRFIRGADISLLKKVEDHGGRFYDNGIERDPIAILRDYGVNYIRLKIWKDPVHVGGYNDLPETVEMAKRAKDLGLPVLLNFHYSNFWADPGRQDKPTAWHGLSFEELTQAVYDYTAHVITTLKAAGALPEMVQIGNEIQGGMLWPDGKTWGDELGVDYGGFDNLVTLLRAGIDGVRDSLEPGDKVKIMLHLADGGDNGLYRWWFDEVTSRGLNDFDVIGFSYYPYWHGSLAALQYNLNDISQRYDKDVIVVETAYAFTLANGDNHPNIFGSREQAAGGYPATVEGQAAFLRDLIRVVRNVPNGRGLGIFYWEPTWLPVQGAGWRDGEGNAWENQALFDFDGNALPSLEVFKTSSLVLDEIRPPGRQLHPEPEPELPSEPTSHTFTYTPSASAPAINSLVVAGSFNGWSLTANPMTEQPDGSWQTTVPLEPGMHEYKFVFNGSIWPANMCYDTTWGDHARNYWVDPGAERCQGPHNNAVITIDGP